MVGNDNDASATQFGWDFQINSAIILFIENYEHVKKIKVEGKTQDVELLLDSGKYIFAQAKAFVNPDDTRNVQKQLKKAIKTLNIKNKPYLKLIYITNSKNPFNKRPEYFRYFSVYPYSELPSECKKVTDDLINKLETENKNWKEFDLESLVVKTLDFYGDDFRNRYKFIKLTVDEFLADIDTDFSKFSKKILDAWQLDLFHNTTIRNVTVLKKDLMWPLIFCVCESYNYDDDDQIFDDLDESDLEFVLTKYREFINKTSERFDFATKILTDYQNYHNNTTNRRNAIKNFVKDKWKDYSNYLLYLNLDPTITKCLSKVIIGTILKKKRNINNVKEKCGV